MPAQTLRQSKELASGDSGRGNPMYLDVAVFDGSFAPAARPTTRRADPWYKDKQYFLNDWLLPSIWKSMFVEAIATTCLVFLSGQVAATLQSYGTQQLGGYIGISNIIFLAIFIYATAPLTGGHMNPMITFSAMFAGLCPFSRGILYICGQIAGATLAGGLLLGVLGPDRSVSVHGGGCFFDSTELSHGQVFLNEVFASFALLYLAYGVGLDPRQAAVFGPHLAPLLVGAALGIVTFATSGIAPGYAGAQMNPARCFAYGIAKRDMSDQWIWWGGPAVAAMLIAVLYNVIEPSKVIGDGDKSSTALPIMQAAGV